MSDDTPTQRFDVSGDAPTERLAAPANETVPPAERKSRRLVIILAIVGGALLLALIVVLVVLLTRGSTTPAALPTSSASVIPTTTASAGTSPSPSPTPSETPSPTATTDPAPPRPSTDPAVDSFTINPTTVDCTSSSTVVITLQWSTSNANTIYFGVDTPDASVGPFFGDSLPASGNSTNDFPSGYRPFDYTCGNGSHTYTITAVSADGTKKDSASVTVSG